MRTKLDRFLRERQISTLRLVKESRQHDPRRRGYSRNHLYAVRRGETDPTRACMVVVLATVRAITGDRGLAAEDLFDLATLRKKAS